MVLLTRFALFGLLLLLPTLPARPSDEALVQVYQEQNERGATVVYELNRSGNHLQIRAFLPGGGEEEQDFILGPTGETLSWTYLDSSRNSLLEAKLGPNRTIRMTGRHRGKPVDKRFELNEQIWNQPFQQGLSPFLQGNEAKTVFWAIGTRGKGELRITRFSVRKEEPSPVPAALEQSGSTGPYQQIKISLHGLLSMFWSGHYWYDASDGSFLLYQGASSYLDGDVTLIKKK